jgi:hypothetical protein
MPSPFPGMNPFLEQDDAWHDFHERFLPAVADRLGEQVMPDYIVKIDEHVYIHEIPPEPRRFVGRADLAMGPTHVADEPRAAVGLMEAPVRVQIPALDVERLAFVEVRDRKSRELITVVELLGPSNKRSGADRDQYLTKRAMLLNGRVHLVEIDLLRGGKPLPVEDRPACDYSVMVSRVQDRPEAGVWPIGLRDRLPTIPVPLREGEPDARIDLQEILGRIFDAAGYAYYIYSGRPDPELGADDRGWAEALIAGDAP